MQRGAKAYILDRVRFEDRGFSSPCWVWQKALTEKGYGRALIPELGKMRVHRATYELYVGPIPEGLGIDHLCRVKACCNPTHLEPVTSAENSRRALPFLIAEGRFGVQRTHCKHGHELTPANRCSHGCRTCYNAYQSAWEKSHPRKRDEYRRAWRAKVKQRAANDSPGGGAGSAARAQHAQGTSLTHSDGGL